MRLAAPEGMSDGRTDEDTWPMGLVPDIRHGEMGTTSCDDASAVRNPVGQLQAMQSCYASFGNGLKVRNVPCLRNKMT